MKIYPTPSFQKTAGGLAAPKRKEGGSATVVFVALLAIMVILAAVNGRALFRLHREVKFMEQQQIRRLNTAPTNTVVISQLDSK